MRIACLTLVLTILAAADDVEALREKELARLEGTWQLIAAETDGKKAPDEQIAKVRVVIKGARHTVYFGDKAAVKDVPFLLDPTKTPKTTDDQLQGGKVIRGIYELDGDTLRSCVAPLNQDRPTELTARAGSGYTLRVFKRVAPK
jgi:uncharacterized protein (TIGR03067 family)